MLRNVDYLFEGSRIKNTGFILRCNDFRESNMHRPREDESYSGMAKIYEPKRIEITFAIGSYYRLYIKVYAAMVNPLMRLIHTSEGNGNHYHWGTDISLS